MVIYSFFFVVKLAHVRIRTLSQAQTGESQVSPLFASLSLASVTTGATPSIELLKDDGSDEASEPLVRKRYELKLQFPYSSWRFRPGTSSTSHTDSPTTTARSSYSAAPSLMASASHGIIQLDPMSPCRPSSSKRKVRERTVDSDSDSSSPSAIRHRAKR